MKKNFAIAIICLVIGVILGHSFLGCVNQSTYVAPVTKNIVETATETAVPTQMPTVRPTLAATTELLYDANIDLKYNGSDYGAFNISWDLKKDSSGKPWSFYGTQVDQVQNACKTGNYGIGGTYMYIETDDPHQSLTPECVRTLEKVSGQENLIIPDQSLGKDRLVSCENGKACDVLSSDQIKAIEPTFDEMNLLASNKDGEFYSVKFSASRVEPNFGNYPGFGLRFMYPSTVTVDQTGVISQMGITNWGKDTLCYIVPGRVGGEESGVYVPGSQEKCVSADNFETATKDNMWSHSSIGKIGNNMYATWYWIPSVDNGKLTLKIVDVDVTLLEKTQKPTNIGPAYQIDQESNTADKYAPWTSGEKLTVEKLYYSYRQDESDGTTWTGWYQFLEGVMLNRNGKHIVLSGGYDNDVTRPCPDSHCVEQSGEFTPDLVGTVVSVDFQPEPDSVWFKSSIPIK